MNSSEAIFTNTHRLQSIDRITSLLVVVLGSLSLTQHLVTLDTLQESRGSMFRCVWATFLPEPIVSWGWSGLGGGSAEYPGTWMGECKKVNADGKN